MKKKHLVSIWYDTFNGSYQFTGLVCEILGDNGKPICFPCAIFKEVFGFELPDHSRFIIS